MKLLQHQFNIKDSYQIFNTSRLDYAINGSNYFAFIAHLTRQTRAKNFEHAVFKNYFALIIYMQPVKIAMEAIDNDRNDLEEATHIET